MALLKTKEVAAKVRVSIEYFRKVVKHNPKFPKPVKLTPKSHPQWIDTEIDNFIANKAA